MKTIESDVKTGKPLKVVGKVSIPVYENVDELVEAESADRILIMFNNANKVRIMGNERAKHQVGKMGKNKRFEIGFELLFNSNVEGLEDIEAVRANCIGSYDVLQETIQSGPVQKAIDDYIDEQTDSVDPKGDAVEGAA